MANYLNLFAGFATFLAACAMSYGLWQPVMNFLGFFPTELFIMCGTMWVMVEFYSIVFLPFTMIVSDDKGG